MDAHRSCTEPYGTIQNYTEPYGCPAEPYRTIWNYTEPYGAIRNHTELYGTRRNHTEPYGITCRAVPRQCISSLSLPCHARITRASGSVPCQGIPESYENHSQIGGQNYKMQIEVGASGVRIARVDLSRGGVMLLGRSISFSEGVNKHIQKNISKG